MRVCLGLAALLAVTAGGTAPLSSSPAKSAEGDGVEPFLVRLERIVQRGDAPAFDALLTDSADRGRAAGFASIEMLPGMTRALIQERDRGPLPGTLPGDGYTVVVDAFEEHGARARVATWALALKRNKDASEAETEWQIKDEERLSSIDDLYRI